MRKTFSIFMEKLAVERDDIVFITGDLGFNAFENLRNLMGERFINAGVAEQNMVSVAAGLASQGYMVIVYSIAPFLVYRALEQIRNDVVFHRMPVFFVGNGGGYGYGIMGSSHHALSDLAVMSSLPGMTCYVPAFKEDVVSMTDKILLEGRPAYLRLGLGTPCPENCKPLGSFHRILANPVSKLTVIAQGPVINNLLNHKDFDTIKNHIDLFVATQMPINKLDLEVEISLKKTGRLFTFEEHVKEGSMTSSLILEAYRRGLQPGVFKSKFAVGYPDNQYGSQVYHQKQSGLDGDTLINDIVKIIAL